MGRLVLNGQSYTGNEGNDHIYGEDPPRPEQGVEGSMYIQYVATKQEDEHGEIIKVPESIVEVYSKIEGEWMPYSGGEVPETQFYSTVIPNPQGTAVGKLTKVNIDGTIFSIDEAGSVVIPNKQGTPLFNLDTVEIDGKLFSVNGIGTPVVANPVESASTDLTKIRIDGTPYNIPVNPTEIIANPSGTPSTELQKISINGSLYSIPTTADVEANPSGSASTALNSIAINNTNYYVPVGSMVEANPSTGTTVASLQRITIDGSIYSIDSGGGGSEVIANPSDPATVVLRKLGVDGTVYSIDSGSGTDVEGNPSGTATDTLNKIRISNTIYDVDNGTTVVANPVGTATDDLDTIQIGNTIYGIEGGNNPQPGLGYQETVLWENTSGTTSSSTITLSSALDNYDAIYIITASNAESNYRSTQIIPISAIDTTGATNFGVFDTGGDNFYYVVLNYVDSTHITLSSWGSSYQIKYYKIVGINYGAGGTPIQPIIYSEEEREVGVWTDGKPLYQKTVLIDNISSTVGIQRFAHSISNIETVITTNGTWINKSDNTPYIGSKDIVRPDDSRSSAGAWADATNIVISTGENRSNQNLYITLQYTKTTDTPGSGTWTPSGVPAVHYSTDEQVVGTWIDGNTLYEKTVTFTAPSNNYVTVATNITDFDKCITYSGIVMLSNGIFEDINYGRPDSSYSTYYTAITANGDIFFKTYEATTGTVYITMRYTKTTS